MKSSSSGLANSDASCIIRFTAVDRKLTLGLSDDVADMLNRFRMMLLIRGLLKRRL